MTDLIRQLGDKLSSSTSAPVNLAKFLDYFAYDFMSSMVFSSNTNMLSHNDKEGLWKMMDDGMPASFFFGHVPWLMPWLMWVPGLRDKFVKHALYGRRKAKKRTEEGSKTKDLFYYLVGSRCCCPCSNELTAIP
jgi:hypothetical protein